MAVPLSVSATPRARLKASSWATARVPLAATTAAQSRGTVIARLTRMSVARRSCRSTRPPSGIPSSSAGTSRIAKRRPDRQDRIGRAEGDPADRHLGDRPGESRCHAAEPQSRVAWNAERREGAARCECSHRPGAKTLCHRLGAALHGVSIGGGHQARGGLTGIVKCPCHRPTIDDAAIRSLLAKMARGDGPAVVSPGTEERLR